MGDLALVDRPHLVGFQGHDSGGSAFEGHEFDFVGLTVSVNVNHGSHITSFQPFGGHGRLEHDSVMFTNHRALSVILRGNRSRRIPARVCSHAELIQSPSSCNQSRVRHRAFAAEASRNHSMPVVGQWLDRKGSCR